MQNYISWGFVGNVAINPSVYVFISGLGEFIGMFIFILMMVGVLLNFNLKLSKGFKQKSFGWIVLAISLSLIVGLMISLGIQYAIFTKYYHISTTKVFDLASLALNPAIVIACMIKGANYASDNVSFYIPIGNGMIYIIMQLLGAILGAYVAYCFFKRLIKKEEDLTILRECFYTRPSIKNLKANYFNEFLATFILVAAIICVNFILNTDREVERILMVGLIVSAIGYGLGGATGYALNPFRDLGPRIVYWFCLANKNESIKKDWKYVQVPILAPILGALVATIVLPGFLY